uniref:VASt domain-containing protein n=1 Tax=Helicotheca tamesis TaxID=374047 RepID=A0A7S2E087_9STRA|mmetsp:Transcript_11415/g.15817  ORF Transcript_11415/g.15817 Transcript_11415/m.15817 type:complete len:413 (+) Transcript_11415:135-1373(+)|eukprot:CAMPEP_0185730134 /NCGR_PEP_ID=MMETSP1171-20130828/8693_1 /TAXON_ID=374046 /ORGANISM="Helicotheca tamensis, Strain CCMP826" /LENGTH=412 /DNA_ID=CAMNT_0028399129 /DNA_START=95 /DNA_END=1333 /DNA_ORIENTATION=+
MPQFNRDKTTNTWEVRIRTILMKTATHFLVFSSVFGILLVLLRLDQTAFASLRNSASVLCWSHFLSRYRTAKNSNAPKKDSNVFYRNEKDKEKDDSLNDVYKQRSPTFILKQTMPSVSLKDAAANAIMDSVVKAYFGEVRQDKDEEGYVFEEETSLQERLKNIYKQRSSIFMLRRTKPSLSLKNAATNAVMNSVVKAYFGEYDRSEDEKGIVLEEKTSLFEDNVPSENAWIELSSGKNHSYGEVAIKDKIFECNLDTFFTSFWSNSAKFPLSTYLNEMWNDTDVSISEWKDSGDGFTMKRRVTYQHPTNARMGPKVVPITKEQVIQKYGTHGISLSTTTRIIGVPIADSFVIEDRILISPHDKKRTVMTAQFSVNFVKTTLFKKTLEKDSRQGMKDYWEVFSKWAPRVIETF